MKLLLTGMLVGILVAGLLSSPLTTGIPLIQKVMAQEEDAEDEGPVKQVLLVANEHVVKVAPDNILHPGGIEYAAMTFNGTIPAPVIAADVGDVLNITIRNDGKTIHSLDFHAGIGPSNVLSGNIPPGESRHVTLHANNPGAWMYHCGADALNGVWEHIANGMYGAVVVHPEDEEPAKEFYLSFGEVFNSADKGLFVGTDGVTGTFDITKFATDQPDLILTNGMAHKYVPSIGEQSKIVLNENPELFKVKPGELTRWYVLSPGPNDGVAFHFISGMITTRDGATPSGDDYGTQDIMDETWWVPPGSASVFEATFPEAGTYVGVDHNMNHVVKGAAFAVIGDENSTSTDHPPGTAVAPKGSESAVADWAKPVSMVVEANATTSGNATDVAAVEANASESMMAGETMNATLAFAQDDMMGNDTGMMGNDTGMMNATLAFAQDDMMGNDTGMMGNDTGMMNATLAFAQEAVVIPSGASNPTPDDPERFYSPNQITISPGTTVTWTNEDATIHTVTQGGSGSTDPPAFDSSIIAAAGTWENTFNDAGEFDYWCTLHPFMTGKVTVA
ncbi:MAG: plastocyanin/azurin family copper-binding protein [Nitrososphaeraceae archaeon]